MYFTVDWIGAIVAVCLTELSSGSVRVQVLASGESGEDVLVKSRTGNENGNEVTAVGKHYLSVVLLYVFNVFVSTFFIPSVP